MDYGALLARFDGFLVDDRHAHLTRKAIERSLRRSVQNPDYERHAKEAFLSSTFEVFCAPGSPTIEESLVSLEYLLIFFKADDAPPATLDDFIAQLDGRAPPEGELRACYDELIADLRRTSEDVSGFQDALRSMCLSMLTEKRADKAAMSEAEFCRLRKHTVGVPSYTECWRAIRGLSFSPDLAALVRESAVLDLAAQLAYLSNDIGSLERDEQTARIDPEGLDPNLVMLRMRELGSRRAALDAVIALHNDQVAAIRRAEAWLLASAHGKDPALHDYLTILRCTVNGNLATTKFLVPMRYQGAAEPLSRLMTW